jgi:hypothetical protein
MATLEVPEKTRRRFIHAAALLSMLDPVRSLDEDPTKTELTREQFLKRKSWTPLPSYALFGKKVYHDHLLREDA